MAKKCLKCEFPDNPDDAHYCGECGAPLERFSWGEKARYTLITEGRLEYLEETIMKYKALEQKYNRTLEVRLSKWWNDLGQFWVFMLIIVLLSFGLSVLFVSVPDCSGKSAATQEVTYQAYKVDGKWGIGTSEENLVIPAQYDTVAPFYGNPAKWVMKKGDKFGIAYTAPREVNATECIYDGFWGHVASTWVWTKDAKGKLDGKLLSNNLRVLKQGVPYLFPGDLNYAWIAPDAADYADKKFILVGPEGKSRFSANGATDFTAPDAEGMAFYKNPAGNWAAVDTAGVQRFVIEGTKAYPFTMGVAPILRGTGYKSRLGFVDRDGKTVIPFDYHVTDAVSKQFTFGSDSYLNWNVTKNGVKGKLHRDGTFTPMSAGSRK